MYYFINQSTFKMAVFVIVLFTVSACSTSAAQLESIPEPAILADAYESKGYEAFFKQHSGFYVSHSQANENHNMERIDHSEYNDLEAKSKSSDMEAKYVCPMHEEVTSDKEGRCPKCGMKLVPIKNEKPQLKEKRVSTLGKTEGKKNGNDKNENESKHHH